jgi:CheY-like chemotaxis protein
MEPKPEGRRLLVVDDDVLVLQILEDVFSSKGFKVASTHDGNIAIELIIKECFDLVLTDLGVPGADGWTIAKQVKAKNPSTPVILLTGHSARYNKRHLVENAVDLVLAKPCTAERLLKAIEMLLPLRMPPARENRRYKRFPATEGAFVAFADPVNPAFIRIGEMIDISRGGLSFRYMESSEPISSSSYLNISRYEDPDLHLSPCRIVYDMEILNKNRREVASETERRCGVQFVDFSQEKLSLLERLIRDIT